MRNQMRPTSPNNPKNPPNTPPIIGAMLLLVLLWPPPPPVASVLCGTMVGTVTDVTGSVLVSVTTSWVMEPSGSVDEACVVNTVGGGVVRETTEDVVRTVDEDAEEEGEEDGEEEGEEEGELLGGRLDGLEVQDANNVFVASVCVVETVISTGTCTVLTPPGNIISATIRV